jgi:hypothetical protein
MSIAYFFRFAASLTLLLGAAFGLTPPLNCFPSIAQVLYRLSFFVRFVQHFKSVFFGGILNDSRRDLISNCPVAYPMRH